MVFIELKPNLSSCIETLSKREYERTLNLLLKEGSVNEEVGEKLEVLRLFLESTDFGHLRGQYEGYLTEGKGGYVPHLSRGGESGLSDDRRRIGGCDKGSNKTLLNFFSFEEGEHADL